MRRISMLLMLVGMLVFAVGPALAATPEIVVESPKDGGTIQGGLVAVKYAVKNFKIVDFTKDTAVSETKGHIHVQMDDNPYSTIHNVSNVWVYAGVKPGPHTLKLWLVHSNHTPLKSPVEKTINFTVEAK